MSAREPTARDPQGRENPDPQESISPIPWYVLAVVIAMTSWGIWYIANAKLSDTPVLGDSRNTLAALQPARVDLVDGAQLYIAHCQACHQASGAGVPGVFPPLAGSEWVQDDPARLVQILLHGVTGPLTVNGVAYNGAMPAFGAKLSDAEIAALASHVRKSWGNGGASVDEAAVGAARVATQSRTTPWEGGDALTKMQEH